MPKASVPASGVFGEWTVIEHLPGQKPRCRCKCGREGFVGKDNLSKGLSTCCHACSIEKRRAKCESLRIHSACLVCNREISRSPSVFNQAKLHFCSIKCREKYCFPPRAIGKNPHKYIERECKQCLLKFSVLRSWVEGGSNASGNFCGRPCYHLWLITQSRGPKNPNWTGGLGATRGEDWCTARRLALKKARYCAVCSRSKGGMLDVHHIVPYRLCHSNRADNLVVLCRVHHGRIEGITRRLERLGLPNSEIDREVKNLLSAPPIFLEDLCRLKKDELAKFLNIQITPEASRTRRSKRLRQVSQNLDLEFQ